MMPRKKVPAAGELSRILVAYNAGQPLKEIARQAGVSEPTLNKILRDAGVAPRPTQRPNRRTPDDVRETLVSLHLAGYTAEAVARETGVPRATVLNILKASGVYRRPPSAAVPGALQELPLVEIADRVNRGESIYALSREFGVTFSGLRKRLEKDGLIPPQPRRRGAISPFEFVQAWQESSSLDEVCDRLGVGKKYAYSRAVRYRRQGVPLKLFAHGRALSWGDLADFAALFGDEDEP